MIKGYTLPWGMGKAFSHLLRVEATTDAAGYWLNVSITKAANLKLEEKDHSSQGAKENLAWNSQDDVCG